MSQHLASDLPDIVAVVPAAGIGSRMRSSIPKQYLTILGKTVLEHTVEHLLTHDAISRVIIVISKDDDYFGRTSLTHRDDVAVTFGGEERHDSVMAGLKLVDTGWVMVHDAARPCVRLSDISELVSSALVNADGAILASPVRDTMKRSNAEREIDHTVSRNMLWHALTPQMFRTAKLITALNKAKAGGIAVTDEASAIEAQGGKPLLVAGHADNIKITQPEDLALATFYLSSREKDKI